MPSHTALIPTAQGTPGRALWRTGMAAVLLAYNPLCAGVNAQSTQAVEAPPTANTAPATNPTTTATPDAPAARPAWDGAIGLKLSRSPNFMGSGAATWHLTPGFFLRYGRISITNAGGFATNRKEDEVRGLTAELVQRDDLRVSLSGRIDGGRDAGDDPALNGLPDIRPTVRARLAAQKKLTNEWRVNAAINPDLLGRGGGVTADVGVSYDWRLSPRITANTGVGLTWANQRYLQSYFGITPAQSITSGHPVYQPSSGLRDVGANLGLRMDISNRWVGFAGINASRLQGPAANSPLSTRPTSWGVQGGVAWRF